MSAATLNAWGAVAGQKILVPASPAATSTSRVPATGPALQAPTSMSPGAVSQPSSVPACALCRAAPPPLASTRAVAWPSALQASPVMAAGECRMGGVTLGAVRRPALVQGSCHTLHLPLLAYSATSARGYAPKSARWAPRPSTPSRRHRIWWAAPMWRGASSSIFARAVSNPLGATPLLLATPLLPATPLTMTQLKARLFITLDPSLVDLPSLDPHSAPPSRPTDRHFPMLQPCLPHPQTTWSRSCSEAWDW